MIASTCYSQDPVEPLNPGVQIVSSPLLYGATVMGKDAEEIRTLSYADSSGNKRYVSHIDHMGMSGRLKMETLSWIEDKNASFPTTYVDFKIANHEWRELLSGECFEITPNVMRFEGAPRYLVDNGELWRLNLEDGWLKTSPKNQTLALNSINVNSAWIIAGLELVDSADVSEYRIQGFKSDLDLSCAVPRELVLNSQFLKHYCGRIGNEFIFMKKVSSKDMFKPLLSMYLLSDTIMEFEIPLRNKLWWKSVDLSLSHNHSVFVSSSNELHGLFHSKKPNNKIRGLLHRPLKLYSIDLENERMRKMKLKKVQASNQFSNYSNSGVKMVELNDSLKLILESFRWSKAKGNRYPDKQRFKNYGSLLDSKVNLTNFLSVPLSNKRETDEFRIPGKIQYPKPVLGDNNHRMADLTWVDDNGKCESHSLFFPNRFIVQSAWSDSSESIIITGAFVVDPFLFKFLQYRKSSESQPIKVDMLNTRCFDKDFIYNRDERIRIPTLIKLDKNSFVYDKLIFEQKEITYKLEEFDSQSGSARIRLSSSNRKLNYTIKANVFSMCDSDNSQIYGCFDKYSLISINGYFSMYFFNSKFLLLNDGDLVSEVDDIARALDHSIKSYLQLHFGVERVIKSETKYE